MFLPIVKSKILLFCFATSTVLVVLSIIAIISIFPNIIATEVYKNVQLIKNTEQYDRFLEIPIPVTFKVYFFNVENPQDVATNGSRPILREIGPYVYKEFRTKIITSTDEEDDTISYYQRERFEFDAEASGNLTEEDYITTLNTPMMSMLQTAEEMTMGTVMLKGCLKHLFPHQNTFFVDAKVKDILFDGIDFCPNGTSFLCSVPCEMARSKKNVDQGNSSLKFSIFNYKTKDDGLFTVTRGIQDVQTLGQIVAFNNSTFTRFWRRLGPNSPCDEVKGTDGILYPPHLNKSTVLQIYTTDICRYVEIGYQKEEFYSGIKGYKFVSNNATLRPITQSPEDDCFCAKATKGPDGQLSCFLDGVVDMQPCTGAPVLLSFPHFLWANDTYREGLEGMNPDEDLHETYLIVEPATGTPLQGMERIQINAVLRPISHIERTRYFPRVVLPLVWIEEGMSLTDEYIDKLNELYFNKIEIVNIAQWTFLGVTCLTIVSGTYFFYKQLS